MRKSLVSLLAGLAICFMALTANAQNVSISGGLGGVNTTYATLTAAFAALNGTAQTSATITVSITGNTAEGTGTAILNAGAWTSITITPSGARTISGGTTAGNPLIDLSGADNVTFDGLNSGGNSLIIDNTTASATSGTSTIRFIQGATSNTITRCTIKGAFSAAVGTNGGDIFFSTDGLTVNGNDNNTISLCDIGPSGANLPTKCIFGNGSTTSTAIGNSGIVINNNDFHDYFGAAVTSSAIYTAAGCNDWTISNNRFFQTATRTFTAGAQHSAIWLLSSTATSGAQNMKVFSNIIGYASNTQTGTYTLAGAFAGLFRPIFFTGITGGTVSRISQNTIASVSMTGSTASGTSTSSPFMMIYVSNGVVNADTNTIGSQSATGSLNFATTSASAADGMGIYNFGSDNFNSRGNNIGGMSMSNSSTGAGNLYGIRINTGSTVTFGCTNNLIGGTVANSMQSSTTAVGTILNGILNANPIGTITGNTIRNFTAAGGTGTTSSASVVGICITSTANQTVGSNLIHTLSNTNAAAATSVCGIQFTGSTANTVEKNFIHSLNNSSTAGLINGINVSGGTTTYKNNMIRLGIDASGADITVSSLISGINEPLGTDNFYNNSVYVGGSNVVSGTVNSFAFNSTQTVNTRVFQDNIFWNARSRTSGTGQNYGIKVAGTGVNPTGLTSNFNVIYVSGTGAMFGTYGGSDIASIGAWRTATGQDGNSIFNSAIGFIAPTGTSSTVDLHLHPTNPTVCEGSGILVASVTDDYDGQTRSGLTPTDIGADAGNFVAQDVSGPAMSYTNLGNTASTADRTLTVTITDATGVPTSGTLKPRIYYKKGAGSYFSQAGVLNAGSGTSGTWGFTIVASDMGGVTAADVISYYVIGQDLAGTPNISSSPSGVVATDVNTVTTPPTPNTYTILTGISGSFNVGTGQTYATLTAAITDLNAKVLTGALTFNLTDASYAGETLPIIINVNGGSSATNTVTIKPASGVNAVISGASATNPVIKLNGADYIIIDGSNNGSSTQNLTITNSSATAPVGIWLASLGTGNGATNNTIKNCIISTGLQTSGSYGILACGTTIGTAGDDNDNLTIQNNAISKCYYGVYAAANSTGLNDNLNISSNSIGSNTAGSEVTNYGIEVIQSTGSTISNNTIFNINRAATGDPAGIDLGAGVVSTTLNANNISGVNGANTGGYGGRGIQINTGSSSSNLIISNNVIYNIKGSGWNGVTSDVIAGIIIGNITSTTGGIKLYYNSVNLGSGSFSGNTSGTISGALIIAQSGVTALDIRNNIFANNLVNTAVTAKAYSIYSAAANTSFTTINNNDFYSSGTQAMLGFLGSDQATIGAWRTASGSDAASFASDPLFASSTDLRIASGSPAYHTGTVVSVTLDYSGTTRNGSTPSVGAYENTLNTSPVITYTALTNTSSTGDRLQTNVTMTDPEGVDVTPTYRPKIYYKKNSGSYFSSQGSLISGSATSGTWQFTIVASDMSGLAVSDVVSYFVIAQDALGAVGSNPAAGLVATDVQTVTTPPTSPNTYTITAAPLAGDYTVGLALFNTVTGLNIEYKAHTRMVTREVEEQVISNDNSTKNSDTKSSNIENTVRTETKKVMKEVEETYYTPMLKGQEYKGELYHELTKAEKNHFNLSPEMTGIYSTVTAAVADVNTRGVSAATRFLLTDASYGSETLPITINAFTGASSSNTLTILPQTSVSAVITGSSTSSVFKLNGADYVIIDGSNNGTSSKNLTITNTNTGTSSAIVWLASATASDGATNNTIKNCILTGNASTTTLMGIFSGGTASISLTSNALTPNTSNTIQNNTISKSQIGIDVIGVSTSTLGSGLNISNNTLGSSTAGDGFLIAGIVVKFQTGMTVSGNDVQNIVGSSGMTDLGGSTTMSGIYNENVTSSTINANKIHFMNYNGATTNKVYALYTATTTFNVIGNPSANTFSNNLIYDLVSGGTSGSWNTTGINNNGGYNDKYYYNSVYLTGQMSGSTGSAPSAAFANGNGINSTNCPVIDIRNNIFYMKGSSASTPILYSHYTTLSTYSGSTIDYNDLVSSASGTATAQIGFLTSSRLDLAAWRTATGLEAASISSDPLFNGNTDLQIQGGSPAYHAGTPVSVTTDYAGITRSGSTPSMGAYENLLNAAPIITYTALTNTSSTADRTQANVTMTDVEGVDTSPSLRPRIYFKKNAGSYFSAQGSLVSGSATSGTWSFVISASAMGGVSASDVISYFVIAQDITGLVRSNPSAGLVASDVNTVTTPPTTPNSYTIVGLPLAGDYIVGDGTFNRVTGLHIEFAQRTRKVMKEVSSQNENAKELTKSRNEKGGKEDISNIEMAFNGSFNSKNVSKNSDKKSALVEVEETYSVAMLNGKEYTGSLYHEFTKEEKKQFNPNNPDMTPGVYATLTAAVADVNSRGVGASDCRFILDDATYAGETFPIIIQSATQLPTATSKLIIKPNTGISPVMSGSSASGLIVSFAPYVTIDGTAIGSTGTRNLTLNNTNTAASTYVVGLFNNTAPNKADNNTIQYCNITGGMTTVSTNAIYGIILNAAGGALSNNLIDNNVITSVRTGIQVAGISGNTSDNCTVSNNTIGSATDASSCFFQGITVSQANSTLILSNDIIGHVTGDVTNGQSTAPSSNQAGIVMSTGATNTSVRKNKIHDWYFAGTTQGYGAFGIVFNNAANNTGTTLISNNLIYAIKGDGDAATTTAANMGYVPQGICIYQNGTSAVQVYYNSIYMTGATLTSNFNGTSSCLGVSSAVGTGSMDVRNNLFRNAMTGAGTGQTSCVWVAGGGSGTLFSAIDYNNYYDDGQNAQIGYIASAFSSTIAAWRTATAKDVSSISGLIPYTSTTNLTIDATSSSAWYVNGNGYPLAAITTDITGAARSTTVAGGSTDLGAYNVIPTSTPPTATASAAPSFGGTTTYTVAGKIIGSIVWGPDPGSGATVPTQIDAQYYPGTYPDSTYLRTRSDCYWKFIATGGSGYSYDITLNYDVSQLSVISAETAINICKSPLGYDWFRYPTTTVNTTTHSATVTGLNSFSFFTLTDSNANNAPLPVELASFTSTIDHRNVELKWSTVTEINNAGFDIERKVTGANNVWSRVGNVVGHGTSSVVNSYSFKERNLPTANYNYRLKQMDNNGNFKYYNLSNEVIVGIPTQFSISQNYPNPFNPSTKINYDLPFDSKVSIVMFDMTGRQVAEILNTTQQAGYQTVQFNASNLSSGTYFYQINAAGGNQSFSKTLKMMLIK